MLACSSLSSPRRIVSNSLQDKRRMISNAPRGSWTMLVVQFCHDLADIFNDDVEAILSPWSNSTVFMTALSTVFSIFSISFSMLNSAFDCSILGYCLVLLLPLLRYYSMINRLLWDSSILCYCLVLSLSLLRYYWMINRVLWDSSILGYCLVLSLPCHRFDSLIKISIALNSCVNKYSLCTLWNTIKNICKLLQKRCKLLQIRCKLLQISKP